MRVAPETSNTAGMRTSSRIMVLFIASFDGRNDLSEGESRGGETEPRGASRRYDLGFYFVVRLSSDLV